MSCGVIDLNRVLQEKGNAYYLTYFATQGGGGSAGNGSMVQLYEDTLALGPKGSNLADVRSLGRGHYLHLRYALYFSTSDNSDPRSNGRSYTWGVPSGVSCPVHICGEVDMKQAKPDSGLSYILPENFGFPGDSSGNGTRSSLQLYEGTQPLGPAHALHADIRQQGNGRYSHWGNTLHFSTSDNSDPRGNGRSYYYGGSCRRLEDIRLTRLAANAPFYATFGSHNQRVVDNAQGLFVAHLTTIHPGPSLPANGLDSQSDWQLLRSRDGGISFDSVYRGDREGTHVSPVVDSDTSGNIYVFEQQFTRLTGADVRFLKFAPASGFRSPSVSIIPGMASDKFSAVFDPSRNQFYYSATGYGPGHPARLATVTTSGVASVGPPVAVQGSHGFLMYPLLRVDETATLFLAWTTQALPQINRYLYWDIHFMRSSDRGRTWTTSSGATLPLPVVVDGDGPTDRVSLADETGSHPWLASFAPRNGMLHFAYESQQPSERMHYTRFNTATRAFDLAEYPVFKGNALSVRGQSGFFAFRHGDPERLLYFVGQNSGTRTLVVLASDDDGRTWFDYAVSRRQFASIYSLSGSRELGPSGNIYGVFTDLHSKDLTQNVNDVWFLSVKAE